MKDVNCEIIKDLLPSYCDKITSFETNKLIEGHIKNCRHCKKIVEDMNKNIEIKTLNEKTEQINYLKGFKKRKKVIILLSIFVTILTLATIFTINVKNKNILLDKDIYVDVNKFAMDYMYTKERIGKNETTGEEISYKTLEIHLNANEYKGMYLTGGCEFDTSLDKEIFYKIAAKELPKGVEFDSEGLYLSFNLMDFDNIEKIYIEDIKHNKKEIWNKNMKIQTEEEWKQNKNLKNN